MAPPPNPANPNADPLNKSCSLCKRERCAINPSDPSGGASKSEFFHPREGVPYYVCSHCDRDTVDWIPGFPEQQVPEDS